MSCHTPVTGWCRPAARAATTIRLRSYRVSSPSRVNSNPSSRPTSAFGPVAPSRLDTRGLATAISSQCATEIAVSKLTISPTDPGR